MTYAEKLKDPRWQKKRLEVMQRDGFKCAACGADDVTLNVHHLTYRFGKDVWNYETDELITLCGNCHEYISEFTKESISLVRAFATSCERAEQIYGILCDLDGLTPDKLLAIRKIISKNG
jgi:hypothetical protein